MGHKTSRHGATRRIGNRKFGAADCQHHCGQREYVPRPVAPDDRASQSDIEAYRAERDQKGGRTDDRVK
jgi:hypothetical protein